MDTLGRPSAGTNLALRGQKFDRLVSANCQITAAQPTGDEIGYLCSSFVRFPLPHSAIRANVFERRDGKVVTTFMSPPSTGMPYGKWPRLLLIFLTTEAVRKRSREINLASSMSHFMKSLCTSVTGGPNGSIRPFKDQLIRTLSLTSTLSIMNSDEAEFRNSPLADEFEIHWAVVCTDQRSGLPARIRLGERMFDQMLKSAVPVDMRAVRAIQQSPLSLDVYAWSTFRAHHVAATHAARISWAELHAQFGTGYASQSDFKIAFRSALEQVQMVYPKLRCDATGSHFVLRKSAPSVPRAPARSAPQPPCG